MRQRMQDIAACECTALALISIVSSCFDCTVLLWTVEVLPEKVHFMAAHWET